MKKLEFTQRDVIELKRDIDLYIVTYGLKKVAECLYESGVTSAEVFTEAMYNDEGGSYDSISDIKFYVGDRKAKFDYATKDWLDFFGDSDIISNKMKIPGFDLVKWMDSLEDQDDESAEIVQEEKNEFVTNIIYHYVEDDACGEYDLTEELDLRNKYEIYRKTK